MKSLKISINESLKHYIQESFFDDVEDITSSNFDEKIVLDFLKDNYRLDLNKVSLRTDGSKIIIDVKGNVDLKNFKIKNFTNELFTNFSNNHNIDLSSIKSQLFMSIENFGINITTNLPNTLISIAKSLVSGGMTFI